MLRRPQRIANLSDVPIVKVFAGSRHSAALLADGSIRTWGRNLSGQLGIGIRSDAESSPTSLQQLEPYQKFTHLALGGSHSLFVDEHGSVWAAGSNEWGQLGLGTALGSLSTAYQRPTNYSQADNAENLMPMPVVMVKTEMDYRVCPRSLLSPLACCRMYFQCFKHSLYRGLDGVQFVLPVGVVSLCHQLQC